MTKLEQPIQSENQLQNDKETFDGEQKDDLAILEEDEVRQDNSSVIEDDGVGSNTYLGKFNSVQDLENAYNSLQAEFTRKCQKLKMLEEDIALSKQKVQEDSNAQQAVYEKQDYQEKLNSFLTNYPNAKKYAKEISLEVINNKNLDLLQAYNNVLASKFKEPEELLKDKDFIDNYILNDDNLKKELIKKYLKDVKESNVPTLISGASGITGSRAKDIEISSLEEANKLALKMFRE